jgi:hypothetical protein
MSMVVCASTSAAAVRAEPLRVTGNSRYRNSWDVAHDATVTVSQLGSEVDRHISVTTVTLAPGGTKEITLELGVKGGGSVFRSIEQQVRHFAVTSYE